MNRLRHPQFIPLCHRATDVQLQRYLLQVVSAQRIKGFGQVLELTCNKYHVPRSERKAHWHSIVGDLPKMLAEAVGQDAVIVSS